MLSQLKTVHDELHAAIAELEAQTAKSVPDQANLPLARLKVVKTSGRRKALIDCKISPCLLDLSTEDTSRMRDLRRADSHLSVETSQHIARWTMRSILDDWDGYRGAAAEITRIMLRRIADEKEVFYPLLQNRAA